MNKIADFLSQNNITFIKSELSIHVTSQNISKLKCPSFSNITFVNCNFTNADCTKINISNVTFTRCNFTHTEFIESNISRCNFTECTMDQSVFDLTSISYTNFIQSTGNDISIVSALLNSITFEKCEMNFIDFSHSIITQSNFQDTSFKISTLNRTDISKSIFHSINFDGSDVHGTIFAKCQMHDISLHNLDLSQNENLRELAPKRGFFNNIININTKYTIFEDCNIINAKALKPIKCKEEASKIFRIAILCTVAISIVNLGIFQYLTKNIKNYSYFFQYEFISRDLPFDMTIEYNPRLLLLLAPLINITIATICTIMFFNINKHNKMNRFLMFASLLMSFISAVIFWATSLDSGIIWLNLMQIPFVSYITVLMRTSLQMKPKTANHIL